MWASDAQVYNVCEKKVNAIYRAHFEMTGVDHKCCTGTLILSSTSQEPNYKHGAYINREHNKI